MNTDCFHCGDNCPNGNGILRADATGALHNFHPQCWRELVSDVRSGKRTLWKVPA